jgi:hypothetical protein
MQSMHSAPTLRLSDRIRRALRLRHHSPRTEEAYLPQRAGLSDEVAELGCLERGSSAVRHNH